jgi:two-component system, chemotaxis family, chemotaxis protein CheY
VKCLIVEDDLASRRLMEIYLSNWAECLTAADGREAVEAFVDALDFGRPFDLICLDVMMPGMNGHEALTEIRRIEAERGIGGLDGVKVIMTTALDDSASILGSFREGCEAYVVKPVGKDKLLAQIENLGLLHPTR